MDDDRAHRLPGVRPNAARYALAEHAAAHPAVLAICREQLGHQPAEVRTLLQAALQDAEAHRQFYNDYNAVLDMPAEYYLDTIRTVFQEHALPRGVWDVAGKRVAPQDIKRTALFTIEGELDDISGLGQTQAAHDLCTGIKKANKHHLTVKGAGHYGIFSGKRWRNVVYPEVREFIRKYS